MYKIYSKPNCPYCIKAKQFLFAKKLPYEEFVLDVGQIKEAATNYYTVPQLQALIAGVRTVPQIFDIDGTLIGGFDALQKKFSNLK